jgi:hypothetical protein
VATRKKDWLNALYAQINDFNSKTFEWGTHDCCTFAAGCVLAVTGVDKMASYRGGYSTKQGATKKLNRAGGMEAALTKELGEPLQNILLAQRGDVVCFTSTLGDTAGICIGSQIAAAGLEGVVYAPMSQAFKAWRI